jgi:hypothetical protein
MYTFFRPTETSGEIQHDVQRVRGTRPARTHRGPGTGLHDQAARTEGRHEGVLGLLLAQGFYCHRVYLC